MYTPPVFSASRISEIFSDFGRDYFELWPDLISVLFSSVCMLNMFEKLTSESSVMSMPEG